MITAAQRAIVSSTVPLLEQGGEALTTHFYKMLLAEHPEVRPFFNETHQAKGDQPRALANGVLMYAKNIDRLEAMGPLATQIVNKHVALQVMPEHYPIVGGCLLRAIRDVLGAEDRDRRGDRRLGAAYGQLADILIGAEKQLYDAKAAAPGGWRGARAFTVARKVRRKRGDHLVPFRPADGGALMDFAPGQYIGLLLRVDGKDIRRNYSLSAAPNGKTYRISVKREPGGVASNHLHERVQVGEHAATAAALGRVRAGRERAASGAHQRRRRHHAHAGDAGAGAGHRARGGVHSLRAQRRRACVSRADRGGGWRHPQQLQRFYCYDEVSDAAAPAPHAVGRLDLDAPERMAAGAHARRRRLLSRTEALHAASAPRAAQWGVPHAQSRFEFFGPASALE
jgi:nitric oxide dioxygenase